MRPSSADLLVSDDSRRFFSRTLSGIAGRRHSRSALAGVTVAIAVLLGSCGGQDNMAIGPAALPVSMEVLNTDEVRTTSQFVGALEASERVTLQPEINGRIIRIFQEEGATVSAGTPIFLLDPQQVEADVEAAISSVNTAKALLREAESSRGEAVANLRFAELEAERFTMLAEEGAESLQTRDDRVKDLEVRQAELQAAEDTVVARQAEVAQAEAQLASLQVDLNHKEVVAPISGVLGSIPLRVGTVVDAGQELTTITQNSQLELNVSVPINRLPDLEIGLPVELIDPNSGELATTGSISFISPFVDQGNQTVLVKFVFVNDGTLKDSQFVQARVIWDTSPGILVPTTAVTLDGSAAFVFVAEETASEAGETQLVARRLPVKLGPIQGQSYQVTSGLSAGDRVITNRLLDLQDGRPIAEEGAPEPESQEESAALIDSDSAS